MAGKKNEEKKNGPYHAIPKSEGFKRVPSNVTLNGEKRENGARREKKKSLLPRERNFI